MAGTLTISTLSDGTNSTSSTNCIQGSAKAWVNYNSNSQTVLSSYNVTSITFVATGKTTVNFTTAMPNTNYSFCGSTGYDNVAQGSWVGGPLSTALSTWKTTTTLTLWQYIALTTVVNVPPEQVNIIVFSS
jgi:hypothetical protein